jgi:hypothetical protein
MMNRITAVLASVLVGSMLSGCTDKEPSSAAKPEVGGKEKYLAKVEPAAAKSVIDVKKDAKDGDPVVVVGRIGGGKRPFTGRAAFTLVDLSLEPNDEDGCGDAYCTFDRDDLLKATALVKFVDQSGKTLPQDAKAFFGVKELQTVVIRGHVKREGDKGLSIVAEEMFARP